MLSNNPLNNLQIILLLIISLLGFPAGYLIAKISPEENKPGEKWFHLIIGATLLSGVISYFYFTFNTFLPIASGLLFILLLALAPLYILASNN